MGLLAKRKVKRNIEAIAKLIYRAGVPMDTDILRDSVPYPELFDEAVDEMERRGLLTVRRRWPQQLHDWAQASRFQDSGKVFSSSVVLHGILYIFLQVPAYLAVIRI